MSALYINLYIKIALGLKVNDFDCEKTWITCKMLYVWTFIVFSYWGPVLTESGTLCITLSSLSHSPTVCIIKITRMKLTFVGHCSHFEDVCKTRAGCKGSLNYAQVSGQVWGLIIQTATVKVADLLQGFGGFVFWEAHQFPLLIQIDLALYITMLCIPIKPMSVSLFSTVGF